MEPRDSLMDCLTPPSSPCTKLKLNFNKDLMSCLTPVKDTVSSDATNSILNCVTPVESPVNAQNSFNDCYTPLPALVDVDHPLDDEDLPGIDFIATPEGLVTPTGVASMHGTSPTTPFDNNLDSFYVPKCATERLKVIPQKPAANRFVCVCVCFFFFFFFFCKA